MAENNSLRPRSIKVSASLARTGSTPSFKGFLPASEGASRAKSKNRAKGTRPERILRSKLWKLGLRFQKNVPTLPGKPDIVFPTKKVAIFCDGDFWHGKDWKSRKVKLSRGYNAIYWVAKIEFNIQRRKRVNRELSTKGWKVIRVWESKIKDDPDTVAYQIYRTIGKIANHLSRSS